jgi:hypothetical protein
MEKYKKNNFKKLLCYNIVNNMKCVYKNKCMFAHNINEQLKEPNREFIHNMIYVANDLSNINIKENKELFEELMIFTKECKNCMNKKCPGGYNCKFGVCVKELKICYNDLLNGKCVSELEEENVNGKIIKRCQFGIHLTEKNLIPYYQRITCEINMLDYGVFLFNNVNYYSKINTISVMLNDNTIKFIKNLISKNKINKNEIVKNMICGDKYNVNFLLDDNKFISDNNDKKTSNIDTNVLDDDILKEYQIEKFNSSINTIDDYFWRYNHTNSNLHNLDKNVSGEDYKNTDVSSDDECFDYINASAKKKNIEENVNDINDVNDVNNVNNKIKKVIAIMNEIDMCGENKTD